MKKKRGIFAGRQQTPPAIPPTQISDAKLLADLDVEIAAAERAANPPEGSTAVINALSLAVERDHKDKDGNRVTDYITVIAWRNTADLCCRYLTKGRQAAVIGSWHNRSYEDKDGNKRTVSECIADDVQFLGGPRRDNAPGGYDDDYPFPDEE